MRELTVTINEGERRSEGKLNNRSNGRKDDDDVMTMTDRKKLRIHTRRCSFLTSLFAEDHNFKTPITFREKNQSI